MKTLSKSALLAGLILGFAQAAQATVITLDFDTVATGSDLLSNDLTVSAGSISLDGATRINGNVFLDEFANPRSEWATFSFDFDVASLTFGYSGNGFGVFNAEALDINGMVIDSFFDSDTSGLSGYSTLASLSGPAIRSFRFGDTPNGGSLSSIDNLAITTSVDVSEPSTLGFLGLVLAGIGFSRKKLNKKAK